MVFSLHTSGLYAYKWLSVSSKWVKNNSKQTHNINPIKMNTHTAQAQAHSCIRGDKTTPVCVCVCVSQNNETLNEWVDNNELSSL